MRHFGVSKQVVADHAVFVRIGDGSRFKGPYLTEGLLDLRLHLPKLILFEFHSAEQGAFRFSKNKVYDVIAHFLVHDFSLPLVPYSLTGLVQVENLQSG